MSHSYPAIFSRQRSNAGPGAVVATFTAPVGDLLEWTTVQRLTVGGPGHQRIKNESKIRAITRFMALDPLNSIPTAVIVALRGVENAEGLPLDACGTLVIPEATEEPGLVIDGQHRLFGISKFDPTTRINVIALINPTDDEIVFQFLVINNKATKVTTDHVKLLGLNYQESELSERLKTARLTLSRHASLVGLVDGSEDSPFFHAVAWPVEDSEGEPRSNLVLPAAIEQAISVIAQKNLPDLKDEDALLDFFFILWMAVKETWPELWMPGSTLLSKVGVITLTTFVIDDLTPLADRGDIDIADPDRVNTEIRRILVDLTPAFWTSEWTARSLDTSAGRQLIVEALIQIRRNNRRGIPWHTDVQLVATPDTASQ